MKMLSNGITVVIQDATAATEVYREACCTGGKYGRGYSVEGMWNTVEWNRMLCRISNNISGNSHCLSSPMILEGRKMAN